MDTLQFHSLLSLGLLISRSQNHSDTLVELIKHHQQAKSNLTLQDAYKLLYQGMFGIRHILSDVDKAREYLIAEFENVEESDEEPLFEDISIDQKFVRINLRPFKKAGYSVDTLFDIMVRSANAPSRPMKDFVAIWQRFKDAVKKGFISFDIRGLERFDQKIVKENYPVIHHSADYKNANKPAYRVVVKNLVKKRIQL